MKKVAILVIIAVVAIAGAFIAFKPGSSGKIEKATIKIGSVSSTNHPVVKSLNEVFKRRLEELSNGNINVQIFDNASLGEESAIMEQTQLGTIQMSSISEIISGIDPKINILNLPYLFENEAEADNVLDSEIGNEILSNLPQHKLVGLGVLENGFRVTTNSKKPIEKLADIKGLKIRTPRTEAQINIFNAFGANVAPLNFSELYSALQQKVVDGQENGYNTIVTQSFYEVQPYLAVTNHMYGTFIIVANNDWWTGLSQDTRDMIKTVIKETIEYERKLSRDMAEENKKVCIDHGVKISEPNLSEFAKAVEPVYENFYKQYPDYKQLVEKILKAKKQ